MLHIAKESIVLTCNNLKYGTPDSGQKATRLTMAGRMIAIAEPPAAPTREMKRPRFGMAEAMATAKEAKVTVALQFCSPKLINK